MPRPYSTLTDSELAAAIAAVFAAEQSAVARQLDLARELDRRTRARIESVFGDQYLQVPLTIPAKTYHVPSGVE